MRQLLTAPPGVVKDVYGVDVAAGFAVVGEAGSGEETLAVVQSTAPDLLLVDLDMPRMSGLEVIRALAGRPSRLRTLILAGDIKKSDLFKAVQLGVQGVVLKDAPTEVLFEAMVSVLAGRCWLDQTLVAALMEIVGTLAMPANSAGGVRPFGLTRRVKSALMCGGNLICVLSLKSKPSTSPFGFIRYWLTTPLICSAFCGDGGG